MIEMVMVIVIVAVLGAVAMRVSEKSETSARHLEAQEELNRLARAIAGDADISTPAGRADFGFVGDNGALPASLTQLNANPGGWSTWKGPYVRDNFNENTGDYSSDPWGVAYSYAGGVTIQSSGSGSTITKQFSASSAELLSNTVVGTILDQNGTPPGSNKTNVNIILTRPNGSGALTTTSINPNSSGYFSFSGIPIGAHDLKAVYTTANDTAVTYVTVYPRAGGHAGTLRFGTDHWSDAGGGSGVISYVAGSGEIKSSRKDAEFKIENTGTASVSITWMKISWSQSSVYAEEVRLDGTKYFDDNCNGFSSGDTAWISPAYSLAVGAIEKIELRKNHTAICGGSNATIADGTTYTVVFSNGNTISFQVYD